MSEPLYNELGEDVSDHAGEPYVGPVYEVGYDAEGNILTATEWERRKSGEIPWDD